MSKVLYITANPRVGVSQCLTLGDKFIKEYKSANPNDQVVELDLYSMDIPEIDNDLLYVIKNMKKGIVTTDMSETTQAKFERYNALTDQFVGADKYVFVTPLWNLGMPSRLKQYVDTFFVAGKAFRYTPEGPIGLLENKKCLHVHASGGFHSNNPKNHADPFLRDVMNFVGVEDYKTLLLEGHAALPDQSQQMIQDALDKTPEFVEWFSK